MLGDCGKSTALRALPSTPMEDKGSENGGTEVEGVEHKVMGGYDAGCL